MGETTSLGKNYLDTQDLIATSQWEQYSPTNSLYAGNPDGPAPSLIEGSQAELAKPSGALAQTAQSQNAPSKPDQEEWKKYAVLGAIRVAPLAVVIACGLGKDDETKPDTGDSGPDTGTPEPETVTFYRDADGDEYGDNSDTIEVPVEEGARMMTTFEDEDGDTYVSEGGDCDDDNASINPGATEVCDGEDNECDGLVDEADDSLDTSTQTTWYLDADGDGFGNESVSQLACEKPDGYVEAIDTDSDGFPDFDCDDTDPYIPSGAAQQIYDGNDNDCDGEIDETIVTRWDGDYDLADVATSTITGVTANDKLGQGIAVVSKTDPTDGGDDGYDDMVMTAPNYNSSTGAIYMVYGDGTGSGRNGSITSVASITITGSSTGDEFGTFVASNMPQIAGMGYDSTDYGAARDAALDSAYLLVGARQGGTKDGYVAFIKAEDMSNGAITDSGLATTIITGSLSSSRALGKMGSWGDLSESSDSDTAVLLQYGYSTTTYGALVFTDPLSATSYSDADATITGSGADGTGNSAVFGDLNGDGVDEVIIGSELASSKVGQVNLQDGSDVTGTISVSSVDMTLVGNDTGGQLGAFVTAGDIDGDGLEDVVAGAPNQDKAPDGSYIDGALYIFVSDGTLSGTLSATDADASIYGYYDATGGYDIQDVGRGAAVADLDLDGFPDLIYTANSYDTTSGGYQDGRVQIKYGLVLTDLTTGTMINDSNAYDASIVGEKKSYLGNKISTLGDVDGDKHPDIFSGSANYSVSSSKQGAAWLIPGTDLLE